MKKLFLIFTFLFCLDYNHTLSQDIKIKWEDSKGRKFSINVVSGDFKWSSLKGDKIKYNSSGKVNQLVIQIYFIIIQEKLSQLVV